MAYAEGRTKILDVASATGAGVSWGGGRGVFSVPVGSAFGTVKLQWSPDDGTSWIDVGTDTTLTAVGAGGFELPPCQVRANVASATSVTAYVHAIGRI